MEKNSDRGISNFRISGQSFKNENCQNSIASHDIDMKLGPETKLDKKNTAISKKKKKKKKKNWRWHHFGKLWFHCLFSDLWPVYSHPEAWFRTHGLILLLWVKSLFLSKILIFCKKIKKNSKTIFFETTYVGIYILICKFPAQSPSSAPSPPTAKQTPKKPILIGVNQN